MQKRYIDNSTRELKVFDEEVKEVNFSHTQKFSIKNEDAHLIRVAINKKPFFYFAHLKKMAIKKQKMILDNYSQQN